MDMCVEQTHEVPAEQRSADRPMRYTDSRMDEQVHTYFCSFLFSRVYSLERCRCVQHAGAHVLHLICFQQLRRTDGRMGEQAVLARAWSGRARVY